MVNDVRIEATCTACGQTATTVEPPRLCSDCLAQIESVFSERNGIIPILVWVDTRGWFALDPFLPEQIAAQVN